MQIETATVSNEFDQNIKMKRITVTIFILVFGVILLTIDFPLTHARIVGTYANNNFNEEPFYVEIPYTKDTLILNPDKTFSSHYYGNGSYELKTGFYSNELSISYNNENGNGGATFPVKNRLYPPMKIVLVYDLNYFYKKIE